MLFRWSLIYIVEDDPVFQEILKKKLEEKKFSNIKTFSSGEECLEKLNENPSVIFLDFSLSGLNGLDVLKKIKSEKPKIKVNIVTVIEEKDVRKKCLKAGANNYFEKTEKGMERLNRVVFRNRWRGIAAFIKKLLKKP
jgi:CheY-like chemotaxis protein